MRSFRVISMEKEYVNVGTGLVFYHYRTLWRVIPLLQLTSSVTCTTQPVVTSNKIIMTVYPIPSIELSAQGHLRGINPAAYWVSGTGEQYRCGEYWYSIASQRAGIGNIPRSFAQNSGTSARLQPSLAIPRAQWGYAYVANSGDNTVSVETWHNSIEAVIPVDPPMGCDSIAWSQTGIWFPMFGNPTSNTVINTTSNTVTSTISQNRCSYNYVWARMATDYMQLIMLCQHYNLRTTTAAIQTEHARTVVCFVLADNPYGTHTLVAYSL